MTEKTEIEQADHLYKPGQSGNPKGRPKGKGLSITTEIKRKLKKVKPGEESTYLQLIIKKILDKALDDGNDAMIKQIWNYIDGLPKETIKQEFDDKVTEVEVKIVRNKE